MEQSGQVHCCIGNSKSVGNRVFRVLQTERNLSGTGKEMKEACINANDNAKENNTRANKELREIKKEKEKIEKDLARKEKALAETATLLVLKKKQMRFGGWTKRKNDQRFRLQTGSGIDQ